MGESKCLPQIMDRINVLLLMVEVVLPRQNLLTFANLKVLNSFRFLSAAAIDIHTPLCYNSCNTRNLLGRKFKYQAQSFYHPLSIHFPKSEKFSGAGSKCVCEF